MKRIYFISVLIFGMLTSGSAQFVEQLNILPESPNSSTFVKISTQTIFSLPNAFLDYSFVKIEGNSIEVLAGYVCDEGSRPSLATDTFAIGTLPEGSYRLIFKCSINDGDFISCDTSFFSIGTCMTASIETPALPELKLYPNPARDEIFMDYLIPNQFNNGFFRVFNIIGEEIERIDISDSTGKIRLNTSSFEPGIYIVKLVKNGTEIITRKFRVVD